MSDHVAVWGYDSNGIMDGAIIWRGTTTTTGGAWSVDYSAVGFTEVPIVNATLVLNSANVYDRGWASLSAAPTTSGASGYGTRAANLLVLGSTARNVPDGTVVHVMAIGEAI
jgi:hypothetical protein